MKQHISMEDIMTLTQDQRESLNNLWQPQVYDLAVGFVCRDAEEGIYDGIEFVVGDILVQESYGKKFFNITLRSLKSMGASEELTDEQLEAMEDVEFDEEAMAFDCFDPEYFNKAECLPLINIGQMLQILSECDYGHGSFYIDMQGNSEKSGVGRSIAEYVSYGRDFEELEICDALWEAVKTLL